MVKIQDHSGALTDLERSLRARVGAYALHAQRDSKETTAKARSAFIARFERDVDPDGTLDPAERARRAEAALRAHMAKMALARERKKRA